MIFEFQKLKLQKHEIGALILSPTRELASQIGQVLQTFLTNLPELKQQMFIGGNNSVVNNDIQKVRDVRMSRVRGVVSRELLIFFAFGRCSRSAKRLPWPFLLSQLLRLRPLSYYLLTPVSPDPKVKYFHALRLPKRKTPKGKSC